MILSNTTYSASDVARATLLKPLTIQTWLKRDLIVGNRGIEGGETQGRHRRFSFHSIISFAIAKQLVDLTLSPKRAFEAAEKFAHSGHGSTQWVGDMRAESPRDTRHPGFPYHHTAGETFLIIWDSGQTVVCAESESKIERPYPALGKPLLIVSCNDVFNSVVSRLTSAHPYAVLDAEYGVNA